MYRAIRHHASYANVTATIALVLALGGSAYAATQINGSQLKNRSVIGKKVKKDALTGAEIKESSLGEVPLAASSAKASQATNAANATQAVNANSASQAANASALGGIAAAGFLQGGGRFISQRGTVPSGNSGTKAPIFTPPGFGTLSLDCIKGPPSKGSLTYDNNTSSQESMAVTPLAGATGYVAGGNSTLDPNTNLIGSGTFQPVGGAPVVFLYTIADNTSASKVLTAFVSIDISGTQCHYYVQALAGI